MRNASILIAGMRGLSNEVCKNIILAGVGSITILDHKNIKEQDFGSQFLIRGASVASNVKNSHLTQVLGRTDLCRFYAAS